MSGWLLDTNVISELRKPRCHEAVKVWSEARAPELLYLSRVTIAEIRLGIEQRASGNFANGSRPGSTASYGPGSANAF